MSELVDNVERAEHAAGVVKAIAHPLRLRIVASLCAGDLRVNEMVERLGASQSAISQQLRILRMAGLVSANRQGGGARYTIIEPRLRDLIQCVAGCRGAADLAR